jgi:hypothetical protein
MTKRKTTKKPTAKPKSKPHTLTRAAVRSSRNLSPTLSRLEGRLEGVVRVFNMPGSYQHESWFAAAAVEASAAGLECLQDVRNALRTRNTNRAVLLALRAGMLYSDACWNWDSANAEAEKLQSQTPSPASPPAGARKRVARKRGTGPSSSHRVLRLDKPPG